MSKGSTRRFHPWKESSNKCASAVSVKVPSRSGLRLDSMQLSMEKIRGLQRNGLTQLKLFVMSRSWTGKREDSSSNSTTSLEIDSAENSPEEVEPHASFRKKLSDFTDHEEWTLVQTRGTKPAPRFNHAAAVVGRKLLVIGGETGSTTRNDVQMLHLGKLSWAKIGVGDSAPSKGLPIKTGPAQELPNCRGHSLITWGKTVILVGGQMDPPEDKVSVWSFDLEMDSWTTVVTKGEIPSSRRGQSVTRAGSILVMLGGEDARGRKLNDLHILDLKSLMWLPLHPSGKGPSPRARHVAEMYDDRFLVVLGGETRSKISNDVYALDFDYMEWSKLRMMGLPLAPRAGHASALVGSKWYIAGGESRAPGMLDTIVLDLVKMDWSVIAPAFQDSVAAFQGLSLSFVERKEKKFLVAFGGYGDQPTNAVQVLHIPPEEPLRMTLAGLLELPSTPDLQVSVHNPQLLRSQPGPLPSFLGAGIPCACVSVAKTGMGPLADHTTSTQRSSRSTISNLPVELERDSGLVPLRMRYAAVQISQKPEPLARPVRPSSEVSRADSMGRRRLSKDSWDCVTSSRRRDLALPKLKDASSVGSLAEASERQLQSAQRIRGDWQSTDITEPPSSVESGILCGEELQITAQSVHPGLVSSVGDAGTLLFQKTASNLSRRRPSGKGGSQSSEFSGYAETFVSGNGEELSISEPSINGSTGSLESSLHIGSISAGCPSEGSSCRTVSYFDEIEHHRSSNGTASDYAEGKRNGMSSGRNSEDRDDELAVAVCGSTAAVVEDELEVFSEFERADSPFERNLAISKLRETHERKLAAAIRTGELLAGQFAEALRNRDEAENILQTVNESRQHAEGRLALALKQIKDLQERLSATEQAREESDSLIHNARVEMSKLEQDLALKNAVLDESQKELQATRGVLIAEGTRAFQLQVELFDAKHKLQNLNPRALQPHAKIQQLPILA